ncbi:hypothetical protein Syun_027269 [Stephania yunnanensis]|uniref:Protein FAR1-RELATED SEQUENCE n=1 Tax=Stephania yunnanensis TaxID=152371 RepID=A0AAP0EKT0_9MAGN
MDDLQIARATALRDIFGSSDSGSSSYENLGCENNAISLADEITSLNVVQEQDLNISSHPLLFVGMLFDSVDELLTAYQDHAKEKGFAVLIRSSVRDTSSQFKYVSISCDRGRNTYFEKHSKRINCPAKVRAVRQGDNCWSVSKVVVEHNHELILNLSCFMRGHRKMSMHMKRQLDANDIAGIRPCKSIRMLQVQSGGPENLGCTPRDCRNFIDARRRLRLGEGDAEAIRKLFITMQERDRKFFHTFEVDNHSRLLNILWVHSRSRAAFEEFSDVVSFDTTYLVNRYRMPFATMVGVNHHGQSILLGCALISHEHVKSFDWLFTNWIRAMGNVYPRCILTDQCESIKAAVMKVMPDSIHRFCFYIRDSIGKDNSMMPTPKISSRKFKGNRRYDSCHLDPNNEIDVSYVPGVEKFNIKECGIDNWHSSIVYSGGYPHMTDEYKKFQEIERALHEAIDLCKNNPASMGFLKREMDALIEKIRSGDIQVDQAQHMDNDASIQGPNYASIRDPTYVRCRGRPRVNRFRSVRERGNSSQGRRNGPRHGRQSRHGGRKDIIDLNEPFIESQNSNVARLNRSLSQPNGPRRGIQSRRGGRMPMTFLTVHNSGEDFVDLNEPIIESQNNNGRILMH